MGRSRSGSSSSGSNSDGGRRRKDKKDKKPKDKDDKKYKDKSDKKDKDKGDKKEKGDEKDKKDKEGKKDKDKKSEAGHSGGPGGLVGELIGKASGGGGAPGGLIGGVLGALLGGGGDQKREVHAPGTAQQNRDLHAPAPGQQYSPAPGQYSPAPGQQYSPAPGQQYQQYSPAPGQHPGGQMPLMPSFDSNSYQQQQQHQQQQYHQQAPPPAYGQPQGNFVPPHGIHLSTHNPLPPPNVIGWPASTDYGNANVYLALVPYAGGVHPGKYVQGHASPLYVSYGGQEVAPAGDFALVPFDAQRMYWAPSRGGDVPYGARPVDGGRESDGTPLFHAIALVNGVRVPGKAGRHLGGASVPYGGQEHVLQDSEILCWR